MLGSDRERNLARKLQRKKERARGGERATGRGGVLKNPKPYKILKETLDSQGGGDSQKEEGKTSLQGENLTGSIFKEGRGLFWGLKDKKVNVKD